MQPKLINTTFTEDQRSLLPGRVVGVERVAISHAEYTGQVSSVGRKEPHQGDGDIVEDEALTGRHQPQACRPKQDAL